MKAKFVKENIDFERGKDPRHQMGVGRGPSVEDDVRPLLHQTFDKFSHTGIAEIEFNEDVSDPKGLGPVMYADHHIIVMVPCSDKLKRKEIIDIAGGTYMNPSGNHDLFYELDNIAHEHSEFYDVSIEPKTYGIPRKGVKIYIAFAE